MQKKRIIERVLEKVIPFVYDVDLFLFKRKKLSNNSFLFKIYYFSLILGLITFSVHIGMGELSILWKTILIGFILIFIIVIYELYRLIRDNRKIKISDDFIIKSSELRKRKKTEKNFNLKLSEQNSKEIYDYLVDIATIKMEVTSFKDFDTVLRNDFGHNHKVVLFLNLAQIRCVFEIFDKYSENFIALALRKKVFLDKNSKEINPKSYRNTSSKNNKISQDSDFQAYMDGLDANMFHFYKK